MTTKYTVSLKSALRMLTEGAGVGTEFMHHRVWMVITGVGQPYKVGKKKLFDFYAEEKTIYEQRTTKVGAANSPGGVR